MDPQLLSSLINLAGGALGLAIVQGISKWVRGHYTAVQRAEDKFKAERKKKEQWLEHALWLRNKLAALGVDLPPRPDDK